MMILTFLLLAVTALASSAGDPVPTTTISFTAPAPTNDAKDACFGQWNIALVYAEECWPSDNGNQWTARIRADHATLPDYRNENTPLDVNVVRQRWNVGFGYGINLRFGPQLDEYPGTLPMQMDYGNGEVQCNWVSGQYPNADGACGGCKVTSVEPEGMSLYGQMNVCRVDNHWRTRTMQCYFMAPCDNSHGGKGPSNGGNSTTMTNPGPPLTTSPNFG